MKLNRIEKALMNNPIRAFLQKNYEAPLLMRLGGKTANARVLEIGCGRGIGTEILFEKFKCSQVTAFDLDDCMVEKARVRLARYSNRLKLYVANATQIPEKDGTFEAVFDFGIIHHIPDWENSIKEISRVLAPGGKFYFEEVTQQALNRWFYRKFLLHPKENRFDRDRFFQILKKHDLQVDASHAERIFGDFIFGVAVKRS